MRHLLYLLLITFFLLKCTPSAKEYMTRASIQTQKFTKTIPYTTVKRLIIVKAKLNNQRTYRFIWDTGAASTVLTRKVADDLGLKKVLSAKVADSHKQSKNLDLVNLKTFELGGVKFSNVAGLVIDYPETSALPCYADGGVIGTNIIAQCNWKIDYARQELTFTSKSYNLDKVTEAIPFKTGFSGKIYFDAQVQGEIIKDILLDSGSSGGLDLKATDKTHAAILKRYASNRLLDGTTQGVYGTRLDTAYVLTLDSVKVGQLPYTRVPVEFSHYVHKKIGNKILQHYTISIDYSNRRMLWQQKKSVKSYNKSLGIVLSRKAGGKVTIGSIYEPSDASEKGINLNDEVVEIDGKPLSNYFDDNCSFYKWLFERSKTEKMQITLKNGKKITLNNRQLSTRFWWRKKE